MATEVKVPALGESITEGTLAQWLKKPGERSPRTSRSRRSRPTRSASKCRRRSAGVLIGNAGQGGRHGRGRRADRADRRECDGFGGRSRCRRIAGDGSRGGTTNPAGAGENPQLRGSEHAPEPAPAAEDANGDQITTLSPAVRRAVLEHHVDPSKIRGTGKDGRLTKDDVIAAAEAQKSGGPVHEPEARVAAPPQPARRSGSGTSDGSAGACAGQAPSANATKSA